MPRSASAVSIPIFGFLALVAACGSDVVPGEPSGAGGGGGATSATATTSDASSTAAGAGVGAPCDVEGSLRCSDDDDGDILHCVGGAFARVGACEAGEGCQNVQGDDAVACGESFLGIVGTPCVAAATAVCDLDREVVLGCEDGTWALFTHCAPTTCTYVPPGAGELCSGMACEGCGYTVGDRCSFPAGTVNCSTDGGAVVGCEGGIATLVEDCRASGLSCTRSGGIIECL